MHICSMLQVCIIATRKGAATQLWVSQPYNCETQPDTYRQVVLALLMTDKGIQKVMDKSKLMTEKKSKQTELRTSGHMFIIIQVDMVLWYQGLILNSGRSYATFGTKIPVLVAFFFRVPFWYKMAKMMDLKKCQQNPENRTQ